MKLFVCYLGGKLSPGRIGEDHEVIVVVAEDLPSAKKKAKEKWQGHRIDVHVDYITELTAIDGYEILLSKKAEEPLNQVIHYQDYDPL